MSPQISWMYGMRCGELVRSFCHHNDMKGRGTSEKLIYASGKVIVVFFHKLNEQKHYCQHSNRVTALASSSHEKNLIASGDGDSTNPSIQIWDINTLSCLVEFKGQHKSDIFLLEFLKNDRHLASCSLRSDTPIYVFDRVTKEVVFSYKTEELIRGIVPILLINVQEIQSELRNSESSNYRIMPKVHHNFMIFSKNKLLYFK